MSTSSLNEAQYAAVFHRKGPLLVLAGAGSGKTRVITERIAALIERDVPADAVTAVTFTNKAAREMRERLKKRLSERAEGLRICTFHALGLQMIRHHADRVGRRTNLSVFAENEQASALRSVLQDMALPNDGEQVKIMLRRISAAKSGMDSGDAALTAVRERYDALLARMNAVDFDDLMVLPIRLLSEHDDVLGFWRERARHFLIDEYQDSSRVQYELVRLLVPSDGNLTVVGDDDQSIYGWRGADVRHILEFEQVWPGAAVHRLEENYRSHGAILKLANAVIRANPDRHEKELKPTREAGERPLWQVCHDEYDEARRILGCLDQRHRQGVPWADMAVLYRSNRQSLPLEQVLREQGVPYRIIGGVGFFERMEIKDALAYWAILNRCGDQMHLLRICNTPKRGIGAKGQEQLAAQLATSGLRAADWLDAQADGAAGPAAKLAELARTLQALRAGIEAMPDRGMDAVLEAVGYDAVLRAHGELEAESRRENVRTLQQYIEMSLAEGLSPVAFMDRAALLQSGEERGEEAEEGVSLMSLHRAKGLEFDTVVLAGVEEGLLPHQRALDEGEAGVAEERRLLYVGITRARNHLMLTSARVRRFFGDMTYPLPSRFLRGIPDEVLARDEGTAMPAGIAAAAEPGITLGAGVRHPTFGEGVILGLEGAGDAARVTVQFHHAGIKRLMLKYAALEPI